MTLHTVCSLLVVLLIDVGNLVEDWQQSVKPYMRKCHYCHGSLLCGVYMCLLLGLEQQLEHQLPVSE